MVLRLPNSWSNWNLEMLVFEERGKPEYPEKNLSEQGREPITNSTHIWCWRRICTRATLVGGERSHHCVTIAFPKKLNSGWKDNPFFLVHLRYHLFGDVHYGFALSTALRGILDAINSKLLLQYSTAYHRLGGMHRCFVYLRHRQVRDKHKASYLVYYLH